VLRGGAFNNNPHNLRAAYRNNNHPENRNDNIGFRVVWSSSGVREHVASRRHRRNLAPRAWSVEWERVLFQFNRTSGSRRTPRAKKKAPCSAGSRFGERRVYLGLDWARLTDLLRERMPGSEDVFLEKIVQVSFDLSGINEAGVIDYVASLVQGTALETVFRHDGAEPGGEKEADDIGL